MPPLTQLLAQPVVATIDLDEPLIVCLVVVDEPGFVGRIEPHVNTIFHAERTAGPRHGLHRASEWSIISTVMGGGRYLAALLLAVGLTAPAWAQYGTSADPYTFITFITEPVNASDRTEMVEAASAWGEYLHETGVGEFNVVFFDVVSEVDAYIRERTAMGKPPVFAAMHNLVAIWRMKEWKATPVLCPIIDGSSTTARLVVVPRSHPAKTLQDLEGSRLAVVRMWAEVPSLLGLTLFSDAVAPTTFFEELVAVESQKDSLIALMRRQADAALVNQGFFDAAQKRNRQVWKEFKVLAELPEQHLAVVVTFEGAPPGLGEALRAAALIAQDSDAGQHLLDVYNVDGFEVCGEEDYARIEGRLLSKLEGPGSADSGSPSADASSADAPAAAALPRSSLSIEELGLEKEATGDLLVTANLSAPAEGAVKARISFDGSGSRDVAMDCFEKLCVGTLSAGDVAGVSKIEVELILDAGGEQSLGKPKSYVLP